MRINELLTESEIHNLEEGPLLNKIGTGLGKVAGTVAKGVGAVAGGVAGLGAAAKKGFAAGKQTVAGAGDTTPGADGQTGQAPAAGGAEQPQGGGFLSGLKAGLSGKANPKQQAPAGGQTGQAPAAAGQAPAAPQGKAPAAPAGGAAPAAGAQGGGTQYNQAKASVDKLNNKDKQRLLQLLQKSVGQKPGATPAAPAPKQPAAAKPAAAAAPAPEQPTAGQTPPAKPAAAPAPEQPAAAAKPAAAPEADRPPMNPSTGKPVTDKERIAHQKAGGKFDGVTGDIIPLEKPAAPAAAPEQPAAPAAAKPAAPAAAPEQPAAPAAAKPAAAQGPKVQWGTADGEPDMYTKTDKGWVHDKSGSTVDQQTINKLDSQLAAQSAKPAAKPKASTGSVGSAAQAAQDAGEDPEAAAKQAMAAKNPKLAAMMAQAGELPSEEPAPKKKGGRKTKPAQSQSEIDAERERVMGPTSDSIIRTAPSLAETLARKVEEQKRKLFIEGVANGQTSIFKK